MHFLTREALLDNGLKMRPMTLPDHFIDHDSPAKQYEQAGLTAAHISLTALQALGWNDQEIPEIKPVIA